MQRLFTNRDDAVKERDTCYAGQNLYYLDSIQQWLIAPNITDAGKVVYRVDVNWEWKETRLTPQAVYFSEYYARTILETCYVKGKHTKVQWNVFRINPVDGKPCYVIEITEEFAIKKYERFAGLSDSVAFQAME